MSVYIHVCVYVTHNQNDLKLDKIVYTLQLLFKSQLILASKKVDGECHKSIIIRSAFTRPAPQI